MAAIDPYLEEFGREAATTRRVLDRIPADQLAWRPHQKSKSLGDLAWHLAVIPHRMAFFAQSDEVDVTTVQPEPAPLTKADLLAGFDRHTAEARSLLAQLDDEDLGRHTVLRRGDRKIFSGPKHLFLRTVLLNHTYHHRGQLSVYLRLLDAPVPSIYGPTADEP